MAAMARAAMEPMAGTFMMAAEEEEEAVADLMAEEAWLAMELIPEAAELMIELTVGLRTTVDWAWAEAARARATATNLFICFCCCLLRGMGPYLYSQILHGAIHAWQRPKRKLIGW